MRARTIQYAIDPETGLVWSRVDNEVLVPVIAFSSMSMADGFQLHYNLEKMNLFDVVNEIGKLKWTRKLSIETKNIHRKFWNMKPLRG